MIGIGSSAHVDIWLPSIKPVPRIRLMLPHTAPFDAKPLLAKVSVGKDSLWDHHDDPNFYRGNRVHLYETAGIYFMLYVKPDIDREWLRHVMPLEDLLRPEPILSQKAELVARVTIAQKLGYHVELTKSEKQQVRAAQNKYSKGE